MRRIARSMSSVSALSILCLISLSGCSKSPERSQKSRSATTSAAVKPINQSAETVKLDSVTVTSRDGASAAPSQQATESPAATSTVTAGTASEEETSAKTKRKSIYNETADARELIANALRRAQRDHKQVLIEWGGNWCGWCHLLHDCFTEAPEIAKIVAEEYELVLIDSRFNGKLMRKYAGGHRVKGFPHLTIVNAEGKVLTNQDTEPLEKGHGHDPELVTKFLSEWMLPKVDAAQLLSEQLENARQQDKRILFRVGDPYCGWCKVLSQFIQDHESLFAKDYIDLKIDTMRMINGEKVAESYRPSEAQGHPWFVILDSAGMVLATSVNQQGNIGYPGAPDEIAHFMKMLRDTRKSITNDELVSIEADLNDFRIRREKSLAEQASN